MRASFAPLIFLFLASCDSGSRNPPATQPAAAPTQQLPTATEVFNLRSACARLGEKILNDNVIGSALTQSQVSNYNAKANRCYVELTIQNADLSKGIEIMHTNLFDGQTGELLAFTKIEKGQKVGMVLKKAVPPAPNDEAGFQVANNYILNMMKDE